MHELVTSKKELDEHAIAYDEVSQNMEHDEPSYMARRAGQNGEDCLDLQQSGDFDFACLIAGHYQAGMVGTIKVANSDGGADSHKH